MEPHTNTDIFDRVRLGYVVVESRRLPQWREFMVSGLGLHLERDQVDHLQFRIDAQSCRFLVEEGTEEDLTVLAWQADDESVLQTLLARLANLNIETHSGSEPECQRRSVDAFWHFKGPKGLRIELFVDAQSSQKPLKMINSGFVSARNGMGHFAMISRKPGAVVDFWRALFDAKRSDRIEDRVDGVTLDIEFLRINARHHSIAVAHTRGKHLDPFRTRIQHLNMEVQSLEDVTQAFVRCRQLGYRMVNNIGQHPNDGEISFYVETPSQFAIELGWNALNVDESEWKEGYYHGMSLWGHKPDDVPLSQRLLQVWRGLLSLGRPEYVPGQRA